jgi:mannosyltransferase OCH1-like enzyme
MIPKIIHYCWFGKNPLPKLATKCIESWRKHLPEYQIIQWNEDNFDLNMYPYTKQAHEQKKYAFVSDVCRLYAIKEYGGVYMDTDVEVLKPIGFFLKHNAFSGFETNYTIPTGIMASEKKGKWATDMLAYYDNRPFLLQDKTIDTTTNVEIITKIMKQKGILLNNKFQEIEGYIAFYPSEYFCPKNYVSEAIDLTENSHCIHHFSGSWYPKKRKFLKKSRILLIKILGYQRIEKLIFFFKKTLKSLNEKYFREL